MTISIDIAIDHQAWAAIDDLDGLARRAVAASIAAAEAPVEDGAELSILLCDDARIRDLNKTWRGKDSATNVLSFPTDEANAAMALGDIIVAYETSAREAEDEAQPLPAYLSHLLVHGMFHLLGYDHETDSEADEMERLESEALATLGIASPYQLEARP